MTIFRAFIPITSEERFLERKDLLGLQKLLHGDINFQVSKESFTALPVVQKNITEAVLIDATYKSTKNFPLAPKMHARKFRVYHLWEADMFFKGGVRYLTALESKAMNYLRDIYLACCVGEVFQGPLCSASVSVSKGKVPNPSGFVGNYVDGWEVLIEGLREYEEEILEKVPSITDKFGYTIEERINMSNYFK